MNSDSALEISTVLADLAEILERNDEATTKALAAAVSDAALEISTPLADLLLAIERSGAESLKIIATALAARPEPAAAQAPTVHVTMPTPEVHVVVPPAAGWRFDVDYLPNGAIKGLTAKRLPS